LVNDNHIREVQCLNIAHDAKVMKLNDAHGTARNTQISDHDNLERKLKQQCAADKLKLRNDADIEIFNLKKDHDAITTKMQKDQDTELNRAKAD
jgi:hypothetical protein